MGHPLKAAGLQATQPLHSAYFQESAKLAVESNASVEYLMDNNIFFHVLSQSTLQPLLYEPQ